MKRMKKILALVLSLALALTLALPAFAADNDITLIQTVTEDGGTKTIEVTIPYPSNVTNGANPEGDHQFKYYKIFDGQYQKLNDQTVLVGIDFNATNGITDVAAFMTALKGKAYVDAYNALVADENNQLTASPFASIVTDGVAQKVFAQEVASVLTNLCGGNKDSLYARAFAQVVYDNVDKNGGTPIDMTNGVELGEGYYLTVDTTTATNTVQNLYVLDMPEAGTWKPEIKVDVPQLDKSVLNTNDSTGAQEWGKVADYDLDDAIPFVLTGTLPKNYADFAEYSYSFVDTLSAGLTLDKGSIKVTVDDIDVTNDFAKTSTVETDGKTKFTVSVSDLKTAVPAATANSVVRVYYLATLDQDATIGGTGNLNEAHLEFSNDPNHTGDGTPTGTTPDDKVTVFTFQVLINKVDEDQKPLPGATFALYKIIYGADNTTSEELVKEIEVDQLVNEKATFTFPGLDAGSYVLKETDAPDGYNTAADMYFEIVPVYDKTATPPTLKDLQFAQGKELEDGSLAASDAEGKIILDADGNAAFTFTPDESNGSYTADIVNLRGILLPSTGGIGTTIFYVVGGLLIIGAGVLLIAKKRMGGHAE